MTAPKFRVVPLGDGFNRTDFRCGSAPLDHYFHCPVAQNIRRHITASFIAVDADQRMAGHYTLASTSIVLGDLPSEVAKKRPRYPTVPAVRMGRLAVDERHKGIGLGGALLADALARIGKAEIAAFAMLVDAKDESAAAFYRHHGLIALPSSPLTLFLSMASIRAFTV